MQDDSDLYFSQGYDDVSELVAKGLTPVGLRNGWAVFRLSEVERVRPGPDGSFEVHKSLDIHHTDSPAEAMYLALQGCAVLSGDENGYDFYGPCARAALAHQGGAVVVGQEPPVGYGKYE